MDNIIQNKSTARRPRARSDQEAAAVRQDYQCHQQHQHLIHTRQKGNKQK